MRDYSRVGPKFWIGSTGKRLRAAGMEAQIVAMYLMTSPHANMLGLYYCPTMFIAHETGLGLEGACKGLRSAIEAGFCEYDEASEVVWVIEMAAYQVGDSLKPGDLRVKGVQNEYASLPENPYLARFYEKYCDAFRMSSCLVNGSPFQAPSKPLRSQEQEQEQEQEVNPSTSDDVLVASDADDDLAPAESKVVRLPDALPPCPHQKLIELYAGHLPGLPYPRVWDGKRAKAATARWRWVLTANKPDGGRYASDADSALDFFDRFFGYVAGSDFLTGRDGKWGGCDLGWLVKAENFAKVISGNYENREATA